MDCYHFTKTDIKLRRVKSSALKWPKTQAIIHPHFHFDGDDATNDQAGSLRMKIFKIVAAV